MRSAVGAWVRRYGPLEVVGTLGALAAAGAVAVLTDQVALAALAGAAGENVGFYGYAGWRAARGHVAGSASTPSPIDRSPIAHGAIARKGIARAASDVARTWTVARRTVMDLAGEFGPAEILDSAVMRPALLYAATLATGNVVVGVLLGKVLADVVFYGVAFASLAVLRRRTCAVTAHEVPNR